MRIGIVSPEYPPTLGGVACSVRRIARNLAQAGLEVRVAVLPNARTPLADGPGNLARHEQDGLVQVFRLGVSPHAVGTPLQTPGRSAHAVVEPRRRTVACYEWLCDFALSVDLIHCFYISQTGFIGGMAAKAAQVPFVASVRGNDIHQSLFDVVEFPQIVWTLEHANALTFVAASLRDEAWRVYPFTSPAHVIWNSVDPADFETATDDEKPQYHFCHPSVGMAGELRYKKGIDRLLEACAAIDKPVEVLLIGEFNFLESVYWHGAVDQVRSAGLSVTVTGRVPHHEMLANYRSADVMAFPARHDGCPNSLLEAMLAGRACACTRTGAMGDIIDASGGGVLIEPYTPAGFQAAIQRLLYDAPLRAELGARAQHFAFTHLSPDRERAAWRNVYESLR